MAFTLGDAETELWDNIVDTDSNNRAISSTVANRLINRVYAILKGYADDSVYAVTATTSGLTFTSSSPYGITGTTDIRRILRAFPASAAGSSVPAGPELARWERWEIAAQHAEDSQSIDTLGLTYPKAYACWRAGTSTAASVGKWNVGIWPKVGTTSQYLLLEVLKYVTALSGSTDVMDLPEIDQHAVVDMASLVAGRMIGRPEGMLSDIRARIPEQLQAAIAQVEREYAIVRPRPSEEPA